MRHILYLHFFRTFYRKKQYEAVFLVQTCQCQLRGQPAWRYKIRLLAVDQAYSEPDRPVFLPLILPAVPWPARRCRFAWPNPVKAVSYGKPSVIIDLGLLTPGYVQLVVTLTLILIKWTWLQMEYLMVVFNIFITQDPTLSTHRPILNSQGSH